jgi:hypothetical protein
VGGSGPAHYDESSAVNEGHAEEDDPATRAPDLPTHAEGDSTPDDDMPGLGDEPEAQTPDDEHSPGEADAGPDDVTIDPPRDEARDAGVADEDPPHDDGARDAGAGGKGGNGKGGPGKG